MGQRPNSSPVLHQLFGRGGAAFIPLSLYVAWAVAVGAVFISVGHSQYRILYDIWLVVTETMEFYDFPYIGNKNPNWLICFRGVATTNQVLYIRIPILWIPIHKQETSHGVSPIYGWFRSFSPGPRCYFRLAPVHLILLFSFIISEIFNKNRRIIIKIPCSPAFCWHLNFFGGARFRQLSNVVHKSCPKSNQRSLWIWYQVGLGCMTRLYELPDQLRHFRVQDLGRWWTWEYVRQMDPFSDEILRFDTSMYWISKEQQLHIVIYLSIYLSIYLAPGFKYLNKDIISGFKYLKTARRPIRTYALWLFNMIKPDLPLFIQIF